MKKYELTEETKTLADGTVLHRIRALRDISRYGVKAGDFHTWDETCAIVAKAREVVK